MKKRKAKQSTGLGYDRIEHVAKSSFKDCSTIIIVPSRSPEPRSDGSHKWPWLHHEFVAAINGLMPPMNNKRHVMFVTGAEVGQAYDDTVAAILAHPELSKWKFIATIEDDNPPPPDALLKLYESIELGPFDGISGMYWTKGELNMPMAYGDPAEFSRTGVLDFRPRDVAKALQQGTIMEVNGIANGCSLFRMSAFRDIPRPWFQTLNEVGQGAMTQDLFWCRKARMAGKRFAVDFRVRVPHMDWTTGTAY